MSAGVGLSARVRRAGGTAFFALPEWIRTRYFASRNGYTASDVPPPVTAPHAETRLLVAPANSAGQGWAWARAAERLDGVAAVDMQSRGGRGFAYPTDYAVPSGVMAHSRPWSRAHVDAVVSGFTHVLAESQVPILGATFRGDVVEERRALARAGLRVASVCHGSDIRLPSRHREHEEWSPFQDEELPLTRSLEASVRRRTAILDELGGIEFVSTPDLLIDRPKAVWLPVAVDTARWRTDAEPLVDRTPAVLHAPSLAGLKGTALIVDRLHAADEADAIRLHLPESIPPGDMPAHVHAADIVLDQFSLGIYGVAAVEAMAAGRLVVSHVSRSVREIVRRETGWAVPIVEATANTLIDVLADVRGRPDHYRAIAARGPAFVSDVHDGRRSAAALRPFLGVAQEAER